MKRDQMLIGGEWVDAEARETLETENPFLGAAWAFVPRAKAADVDRAVEAAWKAFRAPSWSKISATARGALLRKLADLIAVEADRPAEIETRDNGKLITEMRTQLRYIPQWFNYFGGLVDKIEGRVIAARDRLTPPARLGRAHRARLWPCSPTRRACRCRRAFVSSSGVPERT